MNACAPAGARGAPATPAGVRIVVPLLSGGSLRSPLANFLSPRWGGIRYGTKQPNVTRTSNYTRKRAHSKEEPQESWKNPCQIAKDSRVISTGVTENAACGSLSSGFISSLNLFLKSLW